MNYSPYSPTLNAIARNPFRRTLLRTLLHNFSALMPVSHFDGITYRLNCQKPRKSFRRLLLPLFVPVTPLGAHSYKKMGVGGRGGETSNLGPSRSALNPEVRHFQPSTVDYELPALTRTAAPSPDPAWPLAPLDRDLPQGSQQSRTRWPRRQATAAPTRVFEGGYSVERDTRSRQY
jgi:hypothetical protein